VTVSPPHGIASKEPPEPKVPARLRSQTGVAAPARRSARWWGCLTLVLVAGQFACCAHRSMDIRVAEAVASAQADGYTLGDLLGLSSTGMVFCKVGGTACRQYIGASAAPISLRDASKSIREAGAARITAAAARNGVALPPPDWISALPDCSSAVASGELLRIRRANAGGSVYALSVDGLGGTVVLLRRTWRGRGWQGAGTLVIGSEDILEVRCVLHPGLFDTQPKPAAPGGGK
jgi:hypothetical protein